MQIKREIKVGERIADCIVLEEDLVKLANVFSEKKPLCELGHPNLRGLDPDSAFHRVMTIDRNNVVGFISQIEYSKIYQKLTLVIDTYGPMAQNMEQSISELIPKLRMITMQSETSETGHAPLKFITFDLCPKDSETSITDIPDKLAEELTPEN